MKTCIWCKKSESETCFNKVAHIVPQNLGGKKICVNVCDDCNHYFGATSRNSPAIETILKETFNISRARILHSQGEVGKNKAMPKITSVFFNIDLNKPKFTIKLKYQLKRSFQENIGTQLKKGLYKMFLEENERVYGNSLDSKFDFIREYARYGIGEYPVFYFERLFGIIAMTIDLAKHPELLIQKDSQMNYLIQHSSFVEFEFLGHVFSLATSRSWELSFDNYLKETIEPKKKFFKKIKPVSKFTDVDFALSII